MLSTAQHARFDVPGSWAAWNGVHGGLAIALACGSLDQAGRSPLRSVQANFLAPVPCEVPLDVSHTVLRSSSRSSATRAEVQSELGSHVVLTAVHGAARETAALPEVSTSMPPAAAPERCPEVVIPTDLVPFAQHLSVRNAARSRPLGGGDTAQLTAWMRVHAPGLTDEQRTLVLLDAMVPALFALLTAPAPLPSVSLAAHLTDRASSDPDGWHLVRISTDQAAAGWVIESSAVWDCAGTLLGTAQQLRYGT